MLTKHKKITIYTKDVCPYCDQAKLFLRQLGLEFEEINVEHNPELRSKISQENGGWRTVPMIFLGEKFIGGFTDMKKLHDQGELLPLIY